MVEQPLIEIRVRITSKAHKTLTRRAQHLGVDRDLEAGRLLNHALVRLIKEAEFRRAIAQKVNELQAPVGGTE